MLLLAFAIWLQGSLVGTDSIHVIAAYTTVLEHVRKHEGEGGFPILLAREVADHCRDHCPSSRTEHPDDLLDQLRQRGVIADTYRVRAPETRSLPIGCSVTVRLGPIIPLPDTTRIHVPERRDRPDGASRAAASLPADLAVDIKVTTPNTPRAGERAIPNTVSYRYFLQATAEGQYSVVTRILTGAI